MWKACSTGGMLCGIADRLPTGKVYGLGHVLDVDACDSLADFFAQNAVCSSIANSFATVVYFVY